MVKRAEKIFKGGKNGRNEVLKTILRWQNGQKDAKHKF